MATHRMALAPLGVDLETLIEQSAAAGLLIGEYEDNGLPAPERLTEARSKIKGEIDRKRRDRLESELRRREQQLEALKTPDQRRAQIRKEIAELKGQLGK